jgi:hypothetical protein
MLPRAATEFYRLQQRVNATAATEAARIWRRMGDDFDGSWRRHGPAILGVLVEAQTQVADHALRYVPRVLAETDIPDEPAGTLNPARLVGIASDGRPLDSLAFGAVTTAKAAIADGATTRQALGQGGEWLDLMAKLQVADTARQAVGVMTAARKNVHGTVRALNPPSCQRCAILAGRFYRWSTGFLRHPRCDCINVPAASARWAKAEGFLTDTMDAYHAGQIRDLTEAQRLAIDNGADITRVVNATRGMSTTATERGLSKRQLHQANKYGRTLPGATPQSQPDLLGFLPASVRNQQYRAQLTPEGIYQQAAGDRDEAIRLLRQFGYLS